MTLPRSLRLMAWLLASIAAASVVIGAFAIAGTMATTQQESASIGLLLLFLGGSLQSIWQAIAAAAMSLLCLAAARLLDAAR